MFRQHQHELMLFYVCNGCVRCMSGLCLNKHLFLLHQNASKYKTVRRTVPEVRNSQCEWISLNIDLWNLQWSLPNRRHDIELFVCGNRCLVFHSETISITLFINIKFLIKFNRWCFEFSALRVLLMYMGNDWVICISIWKGIIRLHAICGLVFCTK